MNLIAARQTLSKRETALWFGTAVIVAALQLITLLNSGGDLVGSDYAFFLPRLLDGVIFFRTQGLEIPWYTPSYCGGLPFFPDPQSLFYSLPQLLTFLLPAWRAVELTALIMLLIGTISLWFLCREVFGYSRTASLIAVFAMLGNGFFLARMTIGHLSYHSYPLILSLVYLLLSKRFSGLLPVCLSALLLSYFVHSGFHIGPIVIPLSFLLIYLCAAIISERERRASPAEVWLRCAGAGLIAAAISAPKIISSISLLENFPRSHNFDHVNSLFGAILLQVSSFFLPSSYQPFEWSPTEYDYGLSVLMLPLVLAGLYLALIRKPETKDEQSPLMTLLARSALLLLLLFCFLFATGFLSLIDALKGLPFFSAFRVNLRVNAAVLLFFIVISGYAVTRLKSLRYQRMFLFAILLTSFLPGERIRLTAQKLYPDYFRLSTVEFSKYEKRVRESEVSELKIERIGAPYTLLSAYSLAPAEELAKFKAAYPGVPQIDDFTMLSSGASNPTCYFPLFRGYPSILHQGSIFDQEEGEFNAANPACYLFPKENNCVPGAKISVKDRGNLESLANYRNPGWQLPSWMPVLVWISLIAALSSLALPVFHLIHKISAVFG